MSKLYAFKVINLTFKIQKLINFFLDLIGVKTFPGAMENWGLVTFSEGMLVVDPKYESSNILHLTATVIAHELAHQASINCANQLTKLTPRELAADCQQKLLAILPAYQQKMLSILPASHKNT